VTISEWPPKFDILTILEGQQAFTSIKTTPYEGFGSKPNFSSKEIHSKRRFFFQCYREFILWGTISQSSLLSHLIAHCMLGNFWIFHGFLAEYRGFSSFWVLFSKSGTLPGPVDTLLSQFLTQLIRPLSVTVHLRRRTSISTWRQSIPTVKKMDQMTVNDERKVLGRRHSHCLSSHHRLGWSRGEYK